MGTWKSWRCVRRELLGPVRTTTKFGATVACVTLLTAGSADGHVDKAPTRDGNRAPSKVDTPYEWHCPSGKHATWIWDPTYRTPTYPTLEALAESLTDRAAGEFWSLRRGSGGGLPQVLVHDAVGTVLAEFPAHWFGPGNNLDLRAGWLYNSFTRCAA